MDREESEARAASRQRFRDAFSRRLDKAMMNSKRTEFAEYGGQALLARKVGHRDEAVRKWLNGKAFPEFDTIRKISKVLGCSYPWLALGIGSEEEEARENRKSITTLDGAVMYVRGLIQLSGGATAELPKNDPRRSLVDFTAVINGKMVPVHVARSVEQDDGSLLVPIPWDYEQATVLAVVPYRGAFVVLQMPHEQIAKHAVKRPGDFAVTMYVAEGGGLVTDGDEWPRLKQIGKIVT